MTALKLNTATVFWEEQHRKEKSLMLFLVTMLSMGSTGDVSEQQKIKYVFPSLVQVSEVANSKAIEKDGLKRCLKF